MWWYNSHSDSNSRARALSLSLSLSLNATARATGAGDSIFKEIRQSIRGFGYLKANKPSWGGTSRCKTTQHRQNAHTHTHTHTHTSPCPAVMCSRAANLYCKTRGPSGGRPGLKDKRRVRLAITKVVRREAPPQHTTSDNIYATRATPGCCA